jgi:hypothetical protein
MIPTPLSPSPFLALETQARDSGTPDDLNLSRPAAAPAPFLGCIPQRPVAFSAIPITPTVAVVRDCASSGAVAITAPFGDRYRVRTQVIALALAYFAHFTGMRPLGTAGPRSGFVIASASASAFTARVLGSRSAAGGRGLASART